MAIKKKARELVDGDVINISLVGRGANGEPFRVIKSEDQTMIDLGSVFTKKSAAVAPMVAFVAVAKGFDQKAAIEVMQKHDLKTDNVLEQDEATVYLQVAKADLNMDNILVLKQSDAIAIGVTGSNVQKMFQSFNFQSTAFKDVMSQTGALPMIYTAKMALGDVIQNIMEQAGDRGETVTLVKAAIDDFGAYVTEVLKGVPETAFKMDMAFTGTPVLKMDAAQPAKVEDTEAEGQGDSGAASADDATVEKDGEAKTDEEIAAEAAAAEVAKAEDEDKDKGNDFAGAIAAALGPLVEQMTGLTTAVKSTDEKVEKSLKDLGESVTGLATRIEKTETVLNVSVPGAIDREEVVKTETKKNDRPVVPFSSLDTAFNRKPFEESQFQV
jgi:hypothetical protein